MKRVEEFTKRMVDVLASFAGLVLLSPVLLVLSILIRLDSKGPAFYKSLRIGQHGNPFPMWKFRTMQVNSESQGLTTGKDDPRITRLGKVLRKYKIDELPQLFNVLKGDMSLVGPRAMSVRDYQLFNEDWQRRRFSVPPGITCLWQIHGRNSIPFEQWMELDMQYIDKWSLWLDLKIL